MNSLFITVSCGYTHPYNIDMNMNINISNHDLIKPFICKIQNSILLIEPELIKIKLGKNIKNEYNLILCNCPDQKQEFHYL